MGSYVQPQKKERCSCCKGISRAWLLFFNGVVGVIGFFLFSISVFNAVRTGDAKVGLGEAGVIGTISSGAILLFVSILGCVAVVKRNKCLLFIYLFISFCMTFVVLGSGITLFFFVDDLNNVEGGNSDEFGEFGARVESQINDALVAVFNQCCSTELSPGFLNADDSPIDKLPACDDRNQQQIDDNIACFVFIEQYKGALDRIKTTGVCDILAETEVEVGGVLIPVVGNPKEVPGACANGDGTQFKAVFTQLVEDQLKPIAGSILGLGVILFVNLIANVCVLCANKRQYVDMEDYDEYGKPYPYSMRGGQMANGGSDGYRTYASPLQQPGPGGYPGGYAGGYPPSGLRGPPRGPVMY